MRFEQSLIENCAPTLAGIKCGNLFAYSYTALNTTLKELTQVGQRLKGKGVHIEVLAWREKVVLLYVYRPTLLHRELEKAGVHELLAEHGYEEYSVESCLRHLKRRLSVCSCFPHEVGIFLGYPLEDVVGFIKHKGRNCKCCGAWKVYGDEGASRRYFEKLKKCTNIYLQVFAEGRSLIDMTVCA